MTVTQTTTTTASKPSATVNAVLNWFSSETFLHAAGIAAVSVLMGVGTVPVSEGFPILTGLVGLAINTAKTYTSS